MKLTINPQHAELLIRQATAAKTERDAALKLINELFIVLEDIA